MRYALTLIVALAIACAPPAAAPARNATVSVTVKGLPSGASARIWQDAPASGGGYLRQAQLGTTASALDVSALVGAFVEAEPISGSGDRWQPEERFQELKSDTKTMVFSYQHEFMVTIGIWSHGGDASTFSKVMGTVTPDPHWVREGETVTFTATPAAGFRLAHWGLFDYPGATDEQRNSGESPTFTVTVTKPMTLAAGFVPVGTP